MKAPGRSCLYSGCFNFFVYLVFSLFYLAGMFVLVAALSGAYRGIKARWTWAQVPAIILEGGYYRNGPTEYRFNVRYSYAFGGRSYVGHRISADSVEEKGTVPFETSAAEWAQRHLPGSVSVAFVNPRNPDQAALETGFSGTESTGFFFWMPFALVGAAPFLGLLPTKKKKSRIKFFGSLFVGWGLFTLALHLAAGPISLYAWCLMGTYFFAGYWGIRSWQKGIYGRKRSSW